MVRDRQSRGRPAGPRARPAQAAERKLPQWVADRKLVPAAIAGGLLLLFWTARNALFGTPVADDYDFLARIRLAPPIDPFDGGGFGYYWRPLTRQAYYAALGDTLLAAPWVAGALHAAALGALALLLAHIGRRTLPPLAALSFALLPLVAESSRLLLAWPTCAQPLFGTLFAAAAVAAALARRHALAALALLAGLLSYEQAIAAAPLVVAIAWRGAAPPRERLVRLLPVGLALVAWVAGLGVAYAHGVRWPGGGTIAAPGASFAYAAAVVANVDLVAGPARTLLLVAQGALVAIALVLARRDRGPARRGRSEDAGSHAPPPLALAGCAAIGIAGLAPAALAPELWAPRHAFLPSLIVGYAVIGLCARAGPLFAPAWVALRAIALLLAPTATAIVVDEPFGDARTSFPELVRLQRIVAATHEALAQSGAAQVGGAAYWSVPRRSLVAFAGAKAPRVWAGDSTFEWGWLERPERSERQRPYPVVSFDVRVTDPVRIVDPIVVEDYFRASGGTIGGTVRIDSVLAAASRRNGPRPAAVLDEMERLRAGLAAMRGDVALAESLNTTSERRYGTKADHVAIAGWIALARGDERRAAELAVLCLRYEPDHPTGLALRATLAGRAQRAAGTAP